MGVYWRRNGGKMFGKRKIFVRWQLPYGCYHCTDGREVLFDRDYVPICERRPGMAAPQLMTGKEWIANIVRREWFYDDGPSEAKKLTAAMAALEAWNMVEPVMAQIEGLIRSGNKKEVDDGSVRGFGVTRGFV